jgi:hypothetical protein
MWLHHQIEAKSGQIWLNLLCGLMVNLAIHHKFEKKKKKNLAE